MAPDTASPKNEDAPLAVRWSGRLSLTPRILAVNVFALALLAGGFFYLDSYRTRIVDDRLEQSARELKLLAIGLENAPADRQNALIAAYARQTGDRVRRYDAAGNLMADSFAMDAPRYRLRLPSEEEWQRHVARFLDKAVDRVVSADRPPNFEEPAVDRASAWPELVLAAKTRQPQAMNRYAPDRTFMISAAVAVRDGSGLLATENARDITRIVRARPSWPRCCCRCSSPAPSSSRSSAWPVPPCAFASAARGRSPCPACPSGATRSACSPAPCRT